MSNLIEESNVTPVTLSLLLEAAVIEHALEDDEGIYVTEGFPFWIRVLKSSGYIGFTTYISFRQSSTRLDRLELANRFNKRNYFLTSFVDGEKLIIDHVICFKSGLLRETFIRGSRQYANEISTSLSEIDPDYEVLIPLGATEPDVVANEDSNKPEIE